MNSIQIPEKIIKHIKSIMEESNSVIIYFSNSFQLEFVREKYSKDLEKIFNKDKKIKYKIEDNGENFINPASAEILRMININDKEELFNKEMLETMLYLVNNKSFITFTSAIKKRALKETETKSPSEALLCLFQKRIKDDFFRNNKIKLYKKITNKIDFETRMKIFEKIDYFEWIEHLANQRFKEKEYCSYDKKNDSVDERYDVFFHAYPPRFYKLPYNFIERINNTCSYFGLRHDIYGDIILHYIFYEKITFPYMSELYKKREVPPARIVHYEDDTENGLGELKIILYHNSKLPDVINFIKNHWEVIEGIQEKIIPKEKWKNKKTKDIKRELLILNIFNQLKDYTKTIRMLRDKYSIKISYNNLRKVVSRLKKEQARIDKPTYEILIEKNEKKIKSLYLANTKDSKKCDT
ncbi:MAG: hypothetical protein ACWGHO_02730 [Candidatus Moraniibacteriota bacterium]